MSIIGIEIECTKRILRYVDRASTKQLIDCLHDHHIPEKKISTAHPQFCKICGMIIEPDEWEPVEENVISDCYHQSIGYARSPHGSKIINEYPQECKHCGILLKPKKWKKV